MNIYDPAEDSQLLAAAVEQYAHGKVLDMGTGSGIQAITAAKKKKVKSVVAADVNDDALKYAAAAAGKEKVARKITFVKSDLFSSIKGKFDTLIFNPPYLPQDKGIEDAAIYGGRHGYETLQRFIGGCREYLKDNGIILIVFSSRTNKQKVDEAIEGSCLEFEELEQKHLFFETLYTYSIGKSQLLLQLQQKGIKGVALFEKGNRGALYKGSYSGKTVVVKAKRKESAAVATIENEINWLRRLNKEGIGPKLLMHWKGSDWFAYEFVEGEFITDFISTCKEAVKVKGVIIQLLQQCRRLDEMGVNKEEMLRPQKHVLIGKSGKITMLDFERCRKTLRPKNVTQLCQFLAGDYATSMLRQKGININREELLAAAQQYKHKQNEENFKRVENAVPGADRK
ncbi:methyltransferase [Candidatus Woesearchaeota archaeon]|nr:methyltransferase [Candidatus Woesearchaeota archaeon]